MRYLFIFPLYFILHITCLYAQAPAVEWQKCLGGGGGDYGHSIEPTSDGGYITAGYAGSNGGDVSGYHGNADINDYWVVKLNSAGGIQWQKSLGGTYLDAASVIHQTPDQGYIVGGHSASIDGDVTGNHGGVDFLAG